jgi:hypothetical protein
MKFKVAPNWSAKRATRFLLSAGVAGSALGTAHAQIGDPLLLPSVVPSGFNRGHNTAVTEIPRPEFDPVGRSVGSFNLFPSLTSSVGATSNTYYTTNAVSSAFLSNTPSAQLISRWNRHELMFSGTATFREFLGQSRRNETTWQTDTRGRVDIGKFTTVTLEEISSQLTENQFSGETTAVVAALSRYRRDFVSLRAVHSVGRIRLTGVTDYAQFRFQPLSLFTGEARSQTNRDRGIARLTGQFEYARSPDLALFVQASFAGQSFRTDLSPGVPNLDSKGYRVLAGFNFDDPGFVRGSLGVGYTQQDFTASIYKPVSGLSVQGRLDIFPSRLTTVRLEASRTIEITGLSTIAAAYWSNRLTARVDHEAWHRIIVSATAGYNTQNYISNLRNPSASSYQIGVGAQYLSTRQVAVNFSVDYGNRGTSQSTLGDGFDEIRTELGLTYRL